MDAERPSRPVLPEDLERTFGPPLEFEDSTREPPILEPMAPEAAAAPPRSRWVPVAVVALLVVQGSSLALQFLDPEPAPPAPGERRAAPVRITPRDPAPLVEHALRRAHEKAQLGLYQDVVNALAPLAEAAEAGSDSRGLEVHLILARAYAELGEVEKAATHRRKASLTAVGRADLRGSFERGQQLDADGQGARARQAYYELLCLGDPSVPGERELAGLARVALADSLRREALARDDAPELPGAEDGR